MYTQTLTNKLPIWHRLNSKVLFFIFATLFITLFVTYAYLVNKTVMNVVARQRAEKAITTFTSTIGDLESKYLTLNNNVTIDLAYERGFEDANPHFITRNNTVAFAQNQ